MIDGRSNLPVSGIEHSQHSMSLPLPGDGEEAGGGFTLLQVWHILRAYLWLSLAGFLLLAGMSFVAIKLLPKSYEATAALIVNSDNTDPLAGRKQPLNLAYSFFPTQVELINNSVVLRPVVDRLKLQSNPDFTRGYVGNPKALTDVVLANLRQAIRVEQGTNSQFLYVTATARDPELAANLANAVTDEYLRVLSNRTNAPAIERASRYSAQLAELKEQFDRAQSRVAEFREKHAMADLREGQTGDVEGATLSDLEAKLLQARNDRRQLEGRQATTEAVALRGKLDQLQGELGEARATLGPQHPRILQLRSEIEATSKALAESSATQLASARELESKYQAAVTSERNRLLERRALQDEGDKLLMEERAAKENYSQALRGRDEVQFASVGNYQDVTVITRAEPPIKSTKPKKMKLFMLAIAASFALALGGPFAYELFLNRRIRCRDDLEGHFHITTLAEFERMVPAPSA